MYVHKVQSTMYHTCIGCDPSVLGQKGDHSRCKIRDHDDDLTGYANGSVVICFGRQRAMPKDKAFAFCPQQYFVMGATRVICQSNGVWVQEPTQLSWPTCVQTNGPGKYYTK